MVYLDNWENSVESRPGKYTKEQRNRMLLSTETLLGIRRTGQCLSTHKIVVVGLIMPFFSIFLVKSFIDFIPYIFLLPEVESNNLSFLSQNLCQDPLEGFFGCQHQRDGTSDNPSVVQFFSNTRALQVVDNFCRGPVRGNYRGGKAGKTNEQEADCTPLQRRKRPRK